MNKNENYYAKRFGTRLKVFREKKGITQADLSKMTGLTQPVIARLEAGKIKTPRPSTTSPIYKALGLSEADIKSLSSDMAFEVNKDDDKVDVRLTVPYLLKMNKKEAINTIDKYVSSIDEDDLYLVAQFAQALYTNEHVEESNESFKQFALKADNGDIFDVGENSDPLTKEVEVEDSYKQIRTYIRNKTYDLNYISDNVYYLPTINEAYKFNEDMKNVASKIKDNCLNNVSTNILLVGEYGSGKTTFVKTMTNVCNLPYKEFICKANTSKEDFEGHIVYDENGSHWSESSLIETYKNGGIINIVNYNEIKDYAALDRLKKIMESAKYGFIKLSEEIIYRHKDCVMFFSVSAPLNSNSVPLKKSFKDNMDLVINLKLPGRQLLINRVANESKLDEEKVSKLVSCFYEIRRYLENEGEYDARFSQKELVSWAKYAKKSFKPYISFKDKLVNEISFDEDIKDGLLKLVKMYFE